MSTLDDAFVTPIVLLRPASFAAGAPQPRAALVVRFPGDPSIPEAQLREVLVRSLLRQGWELVAAPAGEFEPSGTTRSAPVVYLDGNQVRVEVASQILFDGPLGLDPGIAGLSWLELADATQEVLVLVTVGSTPIASAADADRAARAGHLVGLTGRLNHTTAHEQ